MFPLHHAKSGITAGVIQSQYGPSLPNVRMAVMIKTGTQDPQLKMNVGKGCKVGGPVAPSLLSTSLCPRLVYTHLQTRPLFDPGYTPVKFCVSILHGGDVTLT